MKTFRVLIALAALCVLPTKTVYADDFKTVDGKEYKNVTVSRVEPDGIMIRTSVGISKLYFTELSKEDQERFNYDPAKAKQYKSEETAVIDAYNNQVTSPSTAATKSNKDPQTSPTIWVASALYGTGDRDQDVTKRLQWLIEHPEPDMRVGHAIGVPSTNNSLFVVFVYNGLYYQTELRDGEPISLANVQPAQPTPEEAANAYELWSHHIGNAINGNPTRHDLASAARLSNTPTWQRLRAGISETMKRWNKEDKEADRRRANLDRLQAEQAENARQSAARAAYEAKEKARLENIEQQRRALWPDVHQRERQRTLLEDQKADVQARINATNPETDKNYYTDKPRLDEQRHDLQNAIDNTYRPVPP